ncbi:bifunctional homocysteine S-methyltransferase/methylenetetrahydrofolate reductase [Calidifontibacillus erzurumensis]|uniref:Bifunctional homocysteine S-methyltransferase/methylenetetrahydrofolate reductase n=1 Tax=Calidifontibacillus erzurumensis TaxID=2741433 RepID=A0A8J8GIN4_9BACI|nr:bifunctional homocysteine S-methyltransferase/methylenetetrahydrofolate reductase [Calidifontibacillus erzurumensis]NSL53073.1 bifunctional homocysteine S-methyltransferase/methylenetetrahydrofolate reductase [Calidifontibacillus erzurumensis]
MGILKELQNRILIADGAMGTLLYSFGVDYCFEELNLLQPDRITKIHEAYIEAGAEVIQTNTYGANYLKLARYGLEDQVKDINAAAIKIAKKAANGKAYVLGTLGGIRSIKKSAATIEEIKRSFREQLYTFLLEGVDGLLLETFYDLDELKTVLQIARKETELPIIAQVSIHEVAVLQDGTPLADALKQLEDLGADVVGLNCRLGPHHITKALEEVPLPERAFLSAYPNASLPDYIDGRLIYESDAEYFGECAVNLRNQGVRLIGGCCGTTPRHIKAVREKIQGLAPITYKEVKVKQTEPTVTVLSKRNKPHLHEIVAKERSVIVELDTPKTLNTTSFLEGAKALKEAGIDALTMADNSLASPRICNMAMAAIVKNELGIRPLVHITCRDRNLIGLQSHLMGLDALGIDQVLAVTGDPTKIGDFPGATSVYDLSSFELISLIKQLNEGITFSGKPLQKKTSFSVAAAFNPNVRHLDKAIKRLEKKIKHGADYFISQPIFDEKKFLEVYEHTKHLSKPIYIGIMPIVSSQNAEFLHNEVPGIKLTDEIREKMARCGSDREKAKMEGIAIAKSLIDAAFDLFNGIYLITPFMRYDMTVKLVQYIHQKCANRVQERKITN